MALQLLALMDLSENHQKIIAQIGDGTTKGKLAKASKTNQDIINILATDPDENVYKPALTRCSDLEVLENFFTASLRNSDNETLEFLARNPNLPQEYLTILLEYPNSVIQLLAYINPSTPLNEREKRLTPNVAQTVGEFVEHMVRAYELVLANPFLDPKEKYWGVNISLALQLVGKKETRWDSETTEKLLWHGGIYSDLELLKRDDMDYTKAVFLIKNERNKQVEPSVLSRIVNMYGSNILAYAQPVEKPYLKAATWVNQGLESYTALCKIDLAYLEIPNMLGDDITHWDNYKMLEKGWGTNFVEMAKAAVRL